MATEKPRYRSSYTGPVSNRQVIGGKAIVSKEELADFKRQFGKDMTLRDLLNMDKDEFALARQAKSRGAYRGMRAEEPAKAAPAKKEEDSGIMQRLRRAGLTAKGAEEAGGLSSSAMAALGIAGGAAGRGAGKVAERVASASAKKSSEKMTGALRERMSREEPRGDAGVEIKPAVFRRLREEAKDPLEGRRVGDVAKELKEQAKREAERAATKRATQFRSRTADRMEGYAKGGMAKKKRK